MSFLTAVTLLGLASTAPSGVESFSSLSSPLRRGRSTLRVGVGTSASSSIHKISFRNERRRIPLRSISSSSSSTLLEMRKSDFSSHPYSTYYGTSGSTAKQNFQQNDEMNDVYGYDDRPGRRIQDDQLEALNSEDEMYADYYDGAGGGGGTRGSGGTMGGPVYPDRGERHRRRRQLDDLQEGPGRLARTTPRGAPTFSKRYADEGTLVHKYSSMFQKKNELGSRVSCSCGCIYIFVFCNG